MPLSCHAHPSHTFVHTHTYHTCVHTHIPYTHTVHTHIPYVHTHIPYIPQSCMLMHTVFIHACVPCHCRVMHAHPSVQILMCYIQYNTIKSKILQKDMLISTRSQTCQRLFCSVTWPHCMYVCVYLCMFLLHLIWSDLLYTASLWWFDRFWHNHSSRGEGYRIEKETRTEQQPHSNRSNTNTSPPACFVLPLV